MNAGEVTLSLPNKNAAGDLPQFRIGADLARENTTRISLSKAGVGEKGCEPLGGGAPNRKPNKLAFLKAAYGANETTNLHALAPSFFGLGVPF